MVPLRLSDRTWRYICTGVGQTEVSAPQWCCAVRTPAGASDRCMVCYQLMNMIPTPTRVMDFL